MLFTRREWNIVRVLMLIVAALLILLAFISAPAQAQTPQPQQQFYIFADTAGIASVEGAPDVYMTWVFAKASPTSLPSSGVLVAWDCAQHLVKRLAQVKYELTSDSTGVSGNIEEVDRPWQGVSDERLESLVCTIGPTHIHTDTPPVVPQDQPWLAPGKPRINT